MKNDLNFKKMKVIIPLLGVIKGGGLRVICELANGLSNRGHQIILVTTPILSFPFPLNDKVQLISRLKDDDEYDFIGRLKDFLFIYRTSAKLGGIVLSNYYTTFFIGYLLKLFRGKKHVYFIQGYEPEFFDEEHSFANKIKSLLAKFTYENKPDLRITISQFIKDKIGKKDIIIINDGIDPTIFKANSTTKGKDSKKIICSIALTIKRKGFYDFIKAIEVLGTKRSDFKILLFSSESESKFDLPFPYTMTYPSNDIEIVECLQKSDIFVSASHLEGFGLPGLEAMACGTALITTNSGGITQYAINEMNSLIINVGDVEELTIAIERLLDQPDLTKHIIEGGLLTAKKFTWDIMCENFEKELIKL